ncbi:MAG: DUF2116 family Zn-ribbon domain-containing protein [Promethearchaeota archaeon]
MSKFERHKKSDEPYIYPHKHCLKCGNMIDEAHTYCSACYKKMQQKKSKKRKRRWFKKKKNDKNN